MAKVHILHGRSIPRSPTLQVRLGKETKTMASGTIVKDIIPTHVGGALVVAALLGQKPVALDTPLVADCTITPLTTAHWEGRRILGRSAGLVVLESLRRLWPNLVARMGTGHGRTQVIELEQAPPLPLSEMARLLSHEVHSVIKEDLEIRKELWLVEEAIGMFEDRKWTDAASILRIRRENTVSLVACGNTYALAMGPTLISTAALSDLKISSTSKHLTIDLGSNDFRKSTGMTKAAEASENSMPVAHRQWMDGMEIRTLGDFGRMCINGQVTQLIRVSEGFQEKRLSQIADKISANRDRTKMVAVAGPSSSGKTTFLRRLNIQLQINGLNPVGISLDNYYVDREKTPKDAEGEYDFETIDALDLELLQTHVRDLLERKAVKTARFNFKEGKSFPNGGPTIQLAPGDVLVMEGIHGLNPKLMGDIPKPGSVFRIFIHPATNLAVDRLSRVSATDLRLIRRIVRDRHHRGYSAAENIMRWPSVQAGEQKHIFPFQAEADSVFDSSLIYELAVLKVYAERYLLEVPQDHPAYPTAYRLRLLIDQFISIYPDQVPAVSLLREFIGGSSFDY